MHRRISLCAPKCSTEQPRRRLCDLLFPHVDQTPLQETTLFPASFLPPPSPVQIDFVLPVFLCLTKRAKVTCCQWTVAKKAEWPLKKNHLLQISNCSSKSLSKQKLHYANNMLNHYGLPICLLIV